MEISLVIILDIYIRSLYLRGEASKPKKFGKNKNYDKINKNTA